MSPKWMRQGARQTGFCDLCGAWVDVHRLIQSDVQGLRGAWVCDVHPWERAVRVKPSFLDRGGVGQVMDPDHSMEPAPSDGTGLTGGAMFNFATFNSTAPAVSYGRDQRELNFDPVGSDFTLEFLTFLSTTFSTVRTIAFNNYTPTGATDRGLAVVVGESGGTFIEVHRGSTGVVIAAGPTIGSVNRVSITRNLVSTVVEVFINGVSIHSDVWPTTPIITSTVAHEAGSGPNLSSAFTPSSLNKGSIPSISDVRLFNVVRTDDEIADNWNIALPVPFPDSLVAYWPFSEGINDRAENLAQSKNFMDIVGGGWEEHEAATTWPL